MLPYLLLMGILIFIALLAVFAPRIVFGKPEKRKRKRDNRWRWVIAPRITEIKTLTPDEMICQATGLNSGYVVSGEIQIPFGEERRRVMALIEQRREEETNNGAETR